MAYPQSVENCFPKSILSSTNLLPQAFNKNVNYGCVFKGVDDEGVWAIMIFNFRGWIYKLEHQKSQMTRAIKVLSQSGCLPLIADVES